MDMVNIDIGTYSRLSLVKMGFSTLNIPFLIPQYMETPIGQLLGVSPGFIFLSHANMSQISGAALSELSGLYPQPHSQHGIGKHIVRWVSFVMYVHKTYTNKQEYQSIYIYIHIICIYVYMYLNHAQYTPAEAIWQKLTQKLVNLGELEDTNIATIATIGCLWLNIHQRSHHWASAWRGHLPDVSIGSPVPDYAGIMGNAKFCLCPKGPWVSPRDQFGCFHPIFVVSNCQLNPQILDLVLKHLLNLWVNMLNSSSHEVQQVFLVPSTNLHNLRSFQSSRWILSPCPRDRWPSRFHRLSCSFHMPSSLFNHAWSICLFHTYDMNGMNDD